MRREIGRFAANADDGQQFTIVEYQEEVDVATVEDPPATEPAAIELFTADGERVMFKFNGTYENVTRVSSSTAYRKGRVYQHRPHKRKLSTRRGGT